MSDLTDTIMWKHQNDGNISNIETNSKKEYPREFKEVLLEEKKEIRETLKMMKEDDKTLF